MSVAAVMLKRIPGQHPAYFVHVAYLATHKKHRCRGFAKVGGNISPSD